jgi:hypothetical protein
MFNGDTELEKKFWSARKSEATSQTLGLYPVEREVLEFLEDALTAAQTT